ncbi:MAG: N-acetyl-gamma-glutamyl-phosphate reductase, partial [Treponema sp.]|nr:N-acetyl-gamma-glutamyl-phosphate reductase [Treponema sp.]
MIAGIIGATGYAGAELVRLLSGHPEIEQLVAASVSFEGERLEDMYPNFRGRVSAALVKPEAAVAAADLVFAALPSGVGEAYAQACGEAGKHFVDLSADFRFDDDEATFTAWYGKPYLHPALRQRSVYGLPELKRVQIRERAAHGPVIIGNPGCYPTGASLGIYPAIARGVAGPGTIIVDAASGVTGGGREPAAAFHYPECADAFAPYKIGAHRHTPEINRNVACMAALANRAPSPVIFTPHLAPMNRGILSTIYIPLADAWRPDVPPQAAPRPPTKAIVEQAAKLRELYAAFYAAEPFVRVLPVGGIASTSRVRQSNFCDISLHLDQAGTTLIVATAIDNMVKGAAGQAIQNMNIIMGFAESAGLNAIP